MLRAQNFQTIDDDRHAVAQLRPHTLLPQLAVRAAFPDQPRPAPGHGHGDRRLRTQRRRPRRDRLAHRLRAGDPHAAAWRRRLHRTCGELALHVATGSIDDAACRSPTIRPTRSAPIVSVDGGLVFERLFGSRQQRLMTLEPRFMYLYVPYRNQDDLPVFDTAAADLNLVQLFRTNRYVGADRLERREPARDRLHLAAAGCGHRRAVHRRRRSARPTTSTSRASRCRARCSRIPSPRTSSPSSTCTAYRDWNIARACNGTRARRARNEATCSCNTGPQYDRGGQHRLSLPPRRLEQVDGSVAWPISATYAGRCLRAPWSYSTRRTRNALRPVRRLRIPLLLLAFPRRRAPLCQRPHRRHRHQRPAAA